MAKALACDLCGAFFKYDGDSQNVVRIGYMGTWLDRDHEDKYYEVCPKCMKRFKNLITDIKSGRVGGDEE